VQLTVRYFAGASAAAGLEEELVEVPDAATVAVLAGVLSERHGGRLARVLASSSFLVDEVPGGRERPLAGARLVDVLPPFAGG
jgi:sulfur-carrier protein